MGLDMGLNKNDSEVGTWRQANQIREWFYNHLKNFEENAETPIKKENCEELLAVCKKVMHNHDLAPEILPVSEGYFFGSDEYDEDYFYNIGYTINIINELLEETDWDKDKITYWEWF